MQHATSLNCTHSATRITAFRRMGCRFASCMLKTERGPECLRVRNCICFWFLNVVLFHRSTCVVFPGVPCFLRRKLIVSSRCSLLRLIDVYVLVQYLRSTTGRLIKAGFAFCKIDCRLQDAFCNQDVTRRVRVFAKVFGFELFISSFSFVRLSFSRKGFLDSCAETWCLQVDVRFCYD